MRILINADDAGIDDQATRMIVDAWEQKMISGFCILANGEDTDYIRTAFERDKTSPCFLSAHLNLTDGKALNGFFQGSLLCTDDGYFKIGFWNALLLLMGTRKRRQLFLKQVYEEWDAQINFIKNLCGERQLMAINGHNHIHMLPLLFQVAIQLATKHQIPCVRYVKEHFFLPHLSDMFKPMLFINFSKLIVLAICRFLSKQKDIAFQPVTAEVFGVLYSGHITAEVIKKACSFAEERRIQSIEIIVHPGQSLSFEIDRWGSSARSKAFFIHNNRTKEWEALKQLQNESDGTNKAL